jgi:hypothetical protein
VQLLRKILETELRMEEKSLMGAIVFAGLQDFHPLKNLRFDDWKEASDCFGQETTGSVGLFCLETTGSVRLFELFG